MRKRSLPFLQTGSRRLGLMITLVFSSGHGGCGGLEMLTALPLLFPARVSHEAPPRPDLLGGPTRTVSEPALTSPATKEVGEVHRAVNTPNPNYNDGVIETTNNAIPLGRWTQLPKEAQEAVAKNCTCVNLTCRHSIESCGQLWSPKYDWALRGPVLYPSSIQTVFAQRYR